MSENPDFFEEMLAEGVDPDLVDRFRKFNDASPIRKQANRVAKQAQTLEQENADLRAKLTQRVFKDAGIAVSPSLLNLPDDLDITDTDTVIKWATDNGLRGSSTPSVPQEELDAHAAINDIANGSETPSSSIITPALVAEWAPDKWVKFSESHPDAAEMLKRGQEVRGIAVPT